MSKYNSMINIGASVEAVREAKVAILAILNVTHAEEETKRVALVTLQTVCQVNGATVTNCTLNG